MSDYTTFISNLHYYEHYLFISFWLLFMTGMRIGEAAALQWSDIEFVEPKTQASVRTIYIDTDTLKELQAWREVQQKVLKGCDLVLSYNVSVK